MAMRSPVSIAVELATARMMASGLGCLCGVGWAGMGVAPVGLWSF